MGLSKYCSASEMLVVDGVLSFVEMLRKQIFTFRKRLTECTWNSLIISAVYPNIGFNSTIWTHGGTIFYMYDQVCIRPLFLCFFYFFLPVFLV